MFQFFNTFNKALIRSEFCVGLRVSIKDYTDASGARVALSPVV